MDRPFITIKHEHTNEIIVRKSRFIAQIMPIRTEIAAKEYIKTVKKNFPDASHNCSAYIVFNTSAEINKTNDDGEPAGTAGIPMLEALKKRNISDVAVVVTRYFGGVKLGSNGLIKAYRQSVNSVLDGCILIEKKLCYVVTLNFDYGYFDKITHFLCQYNFTTEKKVFLDKITLTVIAPKTTIDTLTNSVKELTKNTATIQKGNLTFVYTKITE